MSGTIFCDIDGVIFKFHNGLSNVLVGNTELLYNVKEQFDKWEKEGNKIILTTGRPESMRAVTENQLSFFGLYYSQLIMDSHSPRTVINDRNGSGQDTAFSLNLNRDEGFPNVL